MSLRTLRRGATALTLAGATTLAYASLVERRWYRLRVRRVPGVARGLVRVLHISDLHYDPRQEHKRRFVAGLAELEYDLVAITGDVLGAWEAEDAAVELLGGLTAGRPKGARPGVIVLGSNDIYAPIPKTPLSYFRKGRRHIDGPRLETKRLVAGLEDGGYAQLDGRREVLDTPSGPIAVGGLPDPHLPSTVLPRADVVAPLDGDVAARVGLVHAPYTAALDLLISAGYPLLLAGHTHGGQVRVPGYGAVVGNCDLPLDQIRGLSRYRDAWLHVSPGLGTSRYAPVRFACRPEATLLELLP